VEKGKYYKPTVLKSEFIVFGMIYFLPAAGNAGAAGTTALQVFHIKNFIETFLKKRNVKMYLVATTRLFPTLQYINNSE